MKESYNFELTRLKKKKKENIWPSGDFLVWYFHNAFPCYQACCRSWSTRRWMV